MVIQLVYFSIAGCSMKYSLKCLFFSFSATCFETVEGTRNAALHRRIHTGDNGIRC